MTPAINDRTDETTSAFLDTPAARLLRDKLLVVAGDEARAVLGRADLDLAGAVFTGPNARQQLRAVHAVPGLRKMVKLIEPPQLRSTWVTEAEPFAPFVDARDGEALFPKTLDSFLSGQRDAGADLALLPAGHVAGGLRKVLAALITRANEVERDDVLLVLSASPAWLRGKELLKLIYWVKQSKHPVAIAFTGEVDPLGDIKLRKGYRTLFERTGAFAWRTDLSGLDAYAHGALGAAIGTIPSLRKMLAPDEESHARTPQGGFRPQPLQRPYLRFTRSSEMENRWSHAEPTNCYCIPCEGRELSSFSSSTPDKIASQQHNAVGLARLFDQLRAAADREAHWIGMCDDADTAHIDLTTKARPMRFSPSPELADWLELNGEADAQNAPRETPVS